MYMGYQQQSFLREEHILLRTAIFENINFNNKLQARGSTLIRVPTNKPKDKDERYHGKVEYVPNNSLYDVAICFINDTAVNQIKENITTKSFNLLETSLPINILYTINHIDLNNSNKELTATVTYQNKLFPNDTFSVETTIPITATLEEYAEYQISSRHLQNAMKELQYERR
jgi:hypothetical protein